MNDNSLLEAFWVLFAYGWPYWAYGLGIASALVIWGSGCARLGWRITFFAAATLVLWPALFVAVDSGYRAWQSIPDPPREAFSDTGGPFFMLFLGWLPSLVLLGILHLLSRQSWRMFSRESHRVTWFLILFLLAPLASAPAAADTAKPNIVFIFAGDWGWGDLSCHGHP